MTTRRFVATTLLAAALLASLPAPSAAAARRYGLQLGPARVTADRLVAVPVVLRLPKRQRAAALNFTLRWDPAQATLASRGLVAARALQRADADVASRTDAAAGTLRVMVLPAFRADVPPLTSRQIATVYLAPRGARPAALRRWLRRHLRLTDVALGDAQGRELHVRHRRGKP